MTATVRLIRSVDRALCRAAAAAWSPSERTPPTQTSRTRIRDPGATRRPDTSKPRGRTHHATTASTHTGMTAQHTHSHAATTAMTDSPTPSPSLLSLFPSALVFAHCSTFPLPLLLPLSSLCACTVRLFLFVLSCASSLVRLQSPLLAVDETDRTNTTKRVHAQTQRDAAAAAAAAVHISQTTSVSADALQLRPRRPMHHPVLFLQCKSSTDVTSF